MNRITCFAFSAALGSANSFRHANRIWHNHCRPRQEVYRRAVHATASKPEASWISLEVEIGRAQKEGRRFRIDKSKLTPAERQQLRERSRAIPMVADKEPLEVVAEDDNFLVVNKPAHLKMHPSHRFLGGSLLNRAIGHCGFQPHILHRLDMHTTGVVVFAKKRELCNPIMKQFLAGEVKKQYLCVVDGVPVEDIGSSFVVDAPVQRHAEIGYLREIGTSGSDSKPSQTRFTVLDKSPTKPFAILHAAPVTGRTHQIRLHATSHSLPIVGDDLYNAKEHELYPSFEEITRAANDASFSRYADNNPLRKGLKLHAWKISMSNPITQQPMTFCAPPPSGMQELINWAGMEVPV